MTNELVVEKEEVTLEELGFDEVAAAPAPAKKNAVVNVAQLAQSGQQKIAAIGRELNMLIMERQEEIKSIMLGLLSAKNVLFLGKPGTAKSNLTVEFSKRISGANYFQWLLNRTSDPSELLGPISIKAMEKDQFLRKPQGKLPEAHIAFIDEIFKSNSATLNVLLPIMNERIWYNDGIAQPVNLKLVIGASNEFPEDEELSAFYDRFLFRHWVEYVGDSGNQNKMLKQSVALRNGKMKVNQTLLTLDEIEAMQQAVNQITVTDAAFTSLQKLAFELSKKQIHISDRRLVACIHIMQANAFYEGRTQAEPDDMEPLAYVLWERKEDIEDIKTEITKMMNPFKDKVNTAYKEAVEIQDKVMAMTDKTDRANAAIDARNVLEKIAKRIKTVITDAQKEGRDTTEFDKKYQEVVKMNTEIVNKCLLFSMDDSMGDAETEELPF